MLDVPQNPSSWHHLRCDWYSSLSVPSFASPTLELAAAVGLAQPRLLTPTFLCTAYRREQKGKKEASEQKKKDKDKKTDSEEQDKSREEDNDEDEERLEEDEQNEEEDVDN